MTSKTRGRCTHIAIDLFFVPFPSCRSLKTGSEPALARRLHGVCSGIEDVRVYKGPGAIPREEFMTQAAGVDGILCMLTDRVDVGLLEAAGANLKVVSTMSVGHDHVDVAACKSRDIRVGNTPGVLTDSTADLTLTLLLAVARRVPEAIHAAKR